jgi:polyisoprenoid-binding protein YceI
MTLARSRTARRELLFGVVPTVLFSAGVAIAAATGVMAQDAATPTPMGVMHSADGLAECAASEVGTLPEGMEAAMVYAIVPEESAARYRVREELAEVGVQDAVGETRAIIGQIAFGEDGLPLACSRFDVDLRTLQSDSARRDNFLYNNTLQAETYPLATFVLRSVEGLEQPLAEGEERQIMLIGDLTLRDQTKLVAWQADVTMNEGALSGSAATEFEMPDFAIEPPLVPVVLSLDETVRLEIDLTARQG